MKIGNYREIGFSKKNEDYLKKYVAEKTAFDKTFYTPPVNKKTTNYHTNVQ